MSGVRVEARDEVGKGAGMHAWRDGDGIVGVGNVVGKREVRRAYGMRSALCWLYAASLPGRRCICRALLVELKIEALSEASFVRFAELPARAQIILVTAHSAQRTRCDSFLFEAKNAHRRDAWLRELRDHSASWYRCSYLRSRRRLLTQSCECDLII